MYLKEKFQVKNEIIFCAYNLPEMINIARNLHLKIIFCDLEYKTGFYNLSKLKRKLSKKTCAVVLTNMFNSYEQSLKIKKICKKHNIFLIEDNAIYFDNYTISLMIKRVIDATACTEKYLTVELDGKKLTSKSLDKYMDYYFDDKVKNLSNFYQGHLSHLKGMTRSYDDWVIDNVLHKEYWQDAQLFNIEQAVAALDNEFVIHAPSPPILQDWTS